MLASHFIIECATYHPDIDLIALGQDGAHATLLGCTCRQCVVQRALDPTHDLENADGWTWLGRLSTR